MRLAILVLLNAGLLAALGFWLRAEYRRTDLSLRRWLLPALGWRLLLTAISSLWPSPDLIGSHPGQHSPTKWSHWLAAYFWEQPAQIWPTLQSASFHLHGQTVTFYKWSNTLFFYKILALLGVASGGVLWLSGLYLSMLCFMACWGLVRGLAQVFPQAPAAGTGVAFLAWPTVVWWTAGLTKETLVVGAGAGVVALVLPLLYGRVPAHWWSVASRVALSLLLAWLIVRMRYFFALPLLGGLLALAAVRVATRLGWLGSGRSQVAGMALLLAAGGLGAVRAGGEHLSLAYFSREVDANYRHGLLTSAGRPHLHYANWQPTPASLLRHAPLAAAQTLLRPWPGESAQPFYLGAGLENALLAGLICVALLAVWRGCPGHLPAALVALLLGYCLLLAAFIGLSTPNLGTLSRYRAALLPWLLLLLLQNDYVRTLLKKIPFFGKQ